MHAMILLLTGGLTLGDGPSLVSAETVPPGPLELSGRWEGAWRREGGIDGGAVLDGGRLALPMAPAWTVTLVLVDEGDGGCRARMGGADLLGIYYRHGDHVALCLRAAGRGYPERFVDDDRQDVLYLWRVRQAR
jgi:hypothetical protein